MESSLEGIQVEDYGPFHCILKELIYKLDISFTAYIILSDFRLGNVNSSMSIILVVAITEFGFSCLKSRVFWFSKWLLFLSTVLSMPRTLSSTWDSVLSDWCFGQELTLLKSVTCFIALCLPVVLGFDECRSTWHWLKLCFVELTVSPVTGRCL